MRVKFISLLVVVSLFVTGCSSNRYGNFSDASTSVNKEMAENTVKQIAVLYPPGTTILSLKQPTPDPFGISLVEQLRTRGYAVNEFVEGNQTKNTDGMPLHYVVNEIEPRLFQVTTHVGDIKLNRAFMTATDNKTYAAGPWTKEE